eukprot:Clim_evm94s243 gene=Clim_evmTU94s243
MPPNATTLQSIRSKKQDEPMKTLASYVSWGITLWLCLLVFTFAIRQLSHYFFGINLRDVTDSETAEVAELPNEEGTPVHEVYKKYPLVSFYGHIIPAAIWSLMAPFQLRSGLRKRNLKLHKYAGYLFFALSTSLCFTGLGFAVFGMSYTLPLGHWSIFTLDMAVLLLFKLFGYTLYRAFKAIAIDRNIPAHRYWVIMHCAAGLAVSVQRFYIGLWFTAYEQYTGTLFTARNVGVENLKIMFASFAYLAGLSVTVFTPMGLAYFYPPPAGTIKGKTLKTM